MRSRLALVAAPLALLALPVPADTPPRFVVQPARVVNFGSVAAGKSRTLTIKMSNRGGGTVSVEWVGRPSPEFEASVGGVNIDAGRTYKLRFRFQPTEPGLYEAPLTFTTTDPQRPEVTITLRGRGTRRR